MAIMNTLVLLLAAASSGVLAVATFDWDCTHSLATCNNACFAVNCKGADSVLTYDSDKSKRNGRRTRTGCNKTPCSGSTTVAKYAKFGNSCDEYPFASTTNGGNPAGGHQAILRCVDSTENSSEGGQLGNFYKTIKNGDKFNIMVKNYKGAPFCENAHLCKNDGGEFKLSGSSFVNARREAAAQFSDVVAPSNATSAGFRKFVGADGVERLSLSGPDVDFVGVEAWSEDGNVQIIKEVL